jgi:hypothetical protein
MIVDSLSSVSAFATIRAYPGVRERIMLASVAAKRAADPTGWLLTARSGIGVLAFRGQEVNRC